MRLAAAGLALRGHEVLWRGGDPATASPAAAELAGTGDPHASDAGSSAPAAGSDPPGLRRLARVAGVRADLGLGGEPVVTALAGWRAGAHGMLLALDHEAVSRWGALERWCWESLDSFGLLESAGTGIAPPEPPGIEAERLLQWSDHPAPRSPDPCHPDAEILERACERLLARQNGRPPRPAVFLDRDGTLVREKGYLADPRDLELLPGVPQALRALRAAGFALVVVSNQSGVGRAFFPLVSVYETMAELRRRLRAHGVELDAVHFCPHRPDQGCACRKPGTALLERAARDLNLSLRQSFVVGDKLLDVATAARAGAMGVLVRTGYGGAEERRLPDRELGRAPDAVCEDLSGAAEWIMERRGGAPSG
jgi:histidinol-phosphate phosphatase family protein